LILKASLLLLLLRGTHSVMQVSSNGAILRADLSGEIVVMPELSGMPNLSLGLNDRVQLDTPQNRTDGSCFANDTGS